LYQALSSLEKTVLGSGNHFIDGCIDHNGRFVVLIHVGSRMEFSEREAFVFHRDYQGYLERALANHGEIWSIVSHVFGNVGTPIPSLSRS